MLKQRQEAYMGISSKAFSLSRFAIVCLLLGGGILLHEYVTDACNFPAGSMMWLLALVLALVPGMVYLEYALRGRPTGLPILIAATAGILSNLLFWAIDGRVIRIGRVVFALDGRLGRIIIVAMCAGISSLLVSCVRGLLRGMKSRR